MHRELTSWKPDEFEIKQVDHLHPKSGPSVSKKNRYRPQQSGLCNIDRILEGADEMPATLKRTDSGFEKIPVTGQKLMLDTWQGIFL
ncbi:MAG: YjbQ family protein [SAR324 cluster bacterium]|nr:YjbQ family protein [SAR324 cluster bacterium]|tara:strand:- start:251 stop:511 length:261 start_codon:yes stop_codon:yes gene_type:complete